MKSKEKGLKAFQPTVFAENPGIGFEFSQFVCYFYNDGKN